MCDDRFVTPGRLFVVATPIGNLEDVTLRALRVLREVRLIACEDTRRTRNLLKQHGITTECLSCFEHNERERVPLVLARLRAGEDVALVSDAGTPAVSDPGYRLVRAAREAGLPVIPVPGASAALAALSVSGLASDRFRFVGFLPAKAEARRRALRELAPGRETLILFESPMRAVATLGDMLEALGDRDAFLCREATKLHEEYVRGRLSELRAQLAARSEVRGEIVLVVAGAADPGPGAAESPEAMFARLVAAGRTRRDAVKEVARAIGLPAREVYRRVLSTSSP
jgi:16S rRNA (cytidine1402-2'-O)-methyltransferase